MRVTGLSHYNLRANREILDELRDFYVAVVGLRIGERPPFRSFGYWLYAGGLPVLHLSEARAEERRLSHVVSTFDHVALDCTGIEAYEAHLMAHGIAFKRRHVPLAGQDQLFFSDPAGNGVELIFADTELQAPQHSDADPAAGRGGRHE